eukprot:TRINITY_DN29461_c1_g2_i1.p2 TRINITY_DN29461_c1_g2~~TRINITY_DN29461_c1_g2_i1.p2  ORF type:complete len:282 (-),score=14.00 TRINITY_DN29461_c1_g2_i1:93-938(-)
MTTEFIDQHQQFSKHVTRQGLVFLGCIQLKWYNEEALKLSAGIQAQGQASDKALCMLVGSNKASWKPFLKAMRKQPDLLSSEDGFGPFDAWTKKILQSFQFQGCNFRILYPHIQYDLINDEGSICKNYVAFQRMAALTGTIYLDECSHLSFHKLYGPWFGLRAVVIFDDVPYDVPKPVSLDNPLKPEVCEELRQEFQRLLCSKGINYMNVQKDWSKWVFLRRLACPDHVFEYSMEQTKYHYTGDLNFLKQIIWYTTKSQKRRRVFYCFGFVMTLILVFGVR